MIILVYLLKELIIKGEDVDSRVMETLQSKKFYWEDYDEHYDHEENNKNLKDPRHIDRYGFPHNSG